MAGSQMTTLLFLFTLLLGVAFTQNYDAQDAYQAHDTFGCSHPISYWTPLYHTENIYYGPNVGTGKAGEVRMGSTVGVMCYTHGGWAEGSDVWVKVCAESSCCVVGYVPFYQMTCSSGACNLPFCATDAEAQVVA